GVDVRLVDVGTASTSKWRCRACHSTPPFGCASAGLRGKLSDPRCAGQVPKFDGEVETRLTLLACSQASDERAP
ncbi:MAG TPA: hypothetical protein VLS25_00335, partial [Dehalococcoidia bacterium]|nr:hypothetical protein [Dehalococcoidia bacterium]